ncbi:MAG: hypothetical protein AAF600_02545 [Bacteroidota bacterium]
MTVKQEVSNKMTKKEIILKRFNEFISNEDISLKGTVYGADGKKREVLLYQHMLDRFGEYFSRFSDSETKEAIRKIKELNNNNL